MTYLLAAAPGTASNTFKVNLEVGLNCKHIKLKKDNGIGHIFIDINPLDAFLHKICLNFLRKKEKLIYGHIIPTKKNLFLLDKYYYLKEIFVTYRNIYDQLNYFYKWIDNHGICPFHLDTEQTDEQKQKIFNQNDYRIDLSLLLLLEFYKYWFYLYQYKKKTNITLFSYEEIISQNENYQKKIYEKLNIKFDKTNKKKSNIYKKKNFKTNPRHIEIIENYIKFYSNIDFSLII